MSIHARTLTGGCLCGAIRCTVSAPADALRAGVFDDSSGMRIASHIWTKSARHWSHIDPACEQPPGKPA